jgi:hypothetical protein
MTKAIIDEVNKVWPKEFFHSSTKKSGRDSGMTAFAGLLLYLDVIQAFCRGWIDEEMIQCKRKLRHDSRYAAA